MDAISKKEIEKLNSDFTKLHNALLELRHYDIASELSKVFYETSYANYNAGIKFMRKIESKSPRV